jgi:hypothetical protein
MNLRLNRLLVNFKFEVHALTHILNLVREFQQLLVIHKQALTDKFVDKGLQGFDHVFGKVVDDVGKL